MKKRSFMAMMGIVVMMSLVVIMALGEKTKADACSWFKKVHVTIYSSNEQADGFNTSVVKTRLTAKKLIKELQKNGAVANGVKVRRFIDNDTSLILNLSQEFAEDVASSGTAGEYVKVGSVVNTFLDAYEANDILITVEGKAWETGHCIYEEPMTKFVSNSDAPNNEDIEDSQEVSIEVYVSNEQADGFDVKNVQIEELSAQNLIKALQQQGAIAQDITVNSFNDTQECLALDLSAEFLTDVNSSGTAGEYVKVGSVVNTFLKAYNKSEILITVNGSVWETGHTIYENSLQMFN